MELVSRISASLNQGVMPVYSPAVLQLSFHFVAEGQNLHPWQVPGLSMPLECPRKGHFDIWVKSKFQPLA